MVRVVRLGGTSKLELLTMLQVAGIRINEAGLTLFADARFTTSAVGWLMETVELSVASLGLGKGGIFSQIIEHAAGVGLTLCPLELGPYLRLHYKDQPEGLLGQPASQHCAPPGSLTVASAPLAGDDDVPQGFYLRRLNGDLWLRGYYSSPEHIWSAADRFVFCRENST